MFIKHNEERLAKKLEEGLKDVLSWWSQGTCSQPEGSMGNYPDGMQGSGDYSVGRVG